jgi:hypothetical protein
MNDPFEILPSTTSFARFLFDFGDTRWGNTPAQIAETFEEQLREGKKQFGKIDIFDNTGVISFSETKKNLLMWSHYAESHSGMVIEIDSRNIFFNRPSESNNYEGKIHKVRYDKDRPFEVKSWYEWFIYKGDEWIHEKEHRFLINLYNANTFYRCSDPAMNPIQDINRINGKITTNLHQKEYYCMCRIPEEALISITFGALSSSEELNNTINRIRSNTMLAHVKLYKARIHPNNYDLIFVPVN